METNRAQLVLGLAAALLVGCGGEPGQTLKTTRAEARALIDVVREHEQVEPEQQSDETSLQFEQRLRQWRVEQRRASMNLDQIWTAGCTEHGQRCNKTALAQWLMTTAEAPKLDRWACTVTDVVGSSVKKVGAGEGFLSYSGGNMYLKCSLGDRHPTLSALLLTGHARTTEHQTMLERLSVGDVVGLTGFSYVVIDLAENLINLAGPVRHSRPEVQVLKLVEGVWVLLEEAPQPDSPEPEGKPTPAPTGTPSQGVAWEPYSRVFFGRGPMKITDQTLTWGTETPKRYRVVSDADGKCLIEVLKPEAKDSHVRFGMSCADVLAGRAGDLETAFFDSEQDVEANQGAASGLYFRE